MNDKQKNISTEPMRILPLTKSLENALVEIDTYQTRCHIKRPVFRALEWMVAAVNEYFLKYFRLVVVGKHYKPACKAICSYRLMWLPRPSKEHLQRIAEDQGIELTT